MYLSLFRPPHPALNNLLFDQRVNGLRHPRLGLLPRVANERSDDRRGAHWPPQMVRRLLTQLLERFLQRRRHFDAVHSEGFFGRCLFLTWFHSEVLPHPPERGKQNTRER